MGRHAAGDAPEIDRLVDEACSAIGAEIDAMRIPRLRGVVLGGGYGRGEGGVIGDALSNDLDFFVVTEEGEGEDTAESIAEALKPVSEKWTGKLGVEVDFAVKTPWRLRHDQERVMVQELLHGYFDVAGVKGEALFAGIEKRSPEVFPWMEAVRLLMNRGVGLLLAAEVGRSGGFAARNVNKCILGAGDARLIARHKYHWKATDRADALGDTLYCKAVEWKFRPRAEAVCDWETARTTWLEAETEVMNAEGSKTETGRSFYQAARWIARRKTLGELASFGQTCELRVLKRLGRSIRMRRALSDSLKRDWEIFN